MQGRQVIHRLMKSPDSVPLVAIACGGTGGHLFPGMAVGNELLQQGCDVMLLISPKDVDQHAVRTARGMQVVTLPAVGLGRGNIAGFVKGFRASYCEAKRVFASRPPQAVLAMGGFTSAPPVLAGRKFRAATFLHESNAIPGRANRLLAWFVSQAFVGFSSCANRLHTNEVLVTGTPVRPQFTRGDAAGARVALGLQPQRDTLLVVGGSQGASAVNQLVVRCLADLRASLPDIQFLHLTGPKDHEKIAAAYREAGAMAVVRPFLTEMELAMGAATVAVSRAGASSLAELAAMRLPSVLLPYPTAADNHQFHNACAFVDSGAALMLEQRATSGEQLATLVLSLLNDSPARATMAKALEAWDAPHAAEVIADRMLALVEATSQGRWKRTPGAIGLVQADSSSKARDDSSRLRTSQQPA